MSEIEKNNQHICGDDCCCGHDHDHGHDEEQMMTLVLENDEELHCHVIGVFEALDRQYIALLPEGDEEALIYRYTENDSEEGFELENIETDEEFEAAEDALFEILEEDEDWEEDDEDFEFEDGEDEEED